MFVETVFSLNLSRLGVLHDASVASAVRALQLD